MKLGIVLIILAYTIGIPMIVLPLTTLPDALLKGNGLEWWTTCDVLIIIGLISFFTFNSVGNWLRHKVKRQTRESKA